MDSIFELQAGPFLALPLAVVLGLLTADSLWTLRVYRHLRSQKSGSPPGYAFGLFMGVWQPTLLLAVAGLVTLYGSLIALTIFSVGVLWRGLRPGREAAAGFLAGFRDASGELNPALASAFGAAWVLITRGIPIILLLYVSLRYKSGT